MTSQWVGWRLKSPALGLFPQPFIRAQIKENIKARVIGLCAGNSPGTGEFPAQMASYAETVSIWWRHHALKECNQFPGLSKGVSYDDGTLSIVCHCLICHYSDDIMSAMASQISGVLIVCSTVWSGRSKKASDKSPVTRKKYPIDDLIMHKTHATSSYLHGNRWIPLTKD